MDESLKNGSTENIGFIIPVSVVQKFLTAWRRVAKAQNRQASGRTVDQDITRLFCPQDCSAGVSHNSVCVCARARQKSVLLKSAARVSHKCVSQELLSRVSYKSGIASPDNMLVLMSFFRFSLHLGPWFQSYLFRPMLHCIWTSRT